MKATDCSLNIEPTYFSELQYITIIVKGSFTKTFVGLSQAIIVDYSAS
jgi:hypothetical protein